jgi:hypothetical protein
LVGLAAGDLQTLSNNLIIAFATTVVGLLVAIIASTLSGVKKRWYQADAILLGFAADRLAQLGTPMKPEAQASGEQPAQPRPLAGASGYGDASGNGKERQVALQCGRTES